MGPKLVAAIPPTTSKQQQHHHHQRHLRTAMHTKARPWTLATLHHSQLSVPVEAREGRKETSSSRTTRRRLLLDLKKNSRPLGEGPQGISSSRQGRRRRVPPQLPTCLSRTSSDAKGYCCRFRTLSLRRSCRYRPPPLPRPIAKLQCTYRQQRQLVEASR